MLFTFLSVPCPRGGQSRIDRYSTCSSATATVPASANSASEGSLSKKHGLTKQSARRTKPYRSLQRYRAQPAVPCLRARHKARSLSLPTTTVFVCDGCLACSVSFFVCSASAGFMTKKARPISLYKIMICC